MAINNALYDSFAATWWEEEGFLHVLRALNPARFGYMRRMLVEELRLNPVGLKTLDIGCGGGILAEEFAKLRCAVTGLDRSEPTLKAARLHAQQTGLSIEYRQGTAEALPFADGAFDIVYCCDVLEHVTEPARVVAESARVLKPGGVYLYDTINRTPLSKLVNIKLFQDWKWTSFMPPNLHVYELFIKPDELRDMLRRVGLESRHQTGMNPSVNPLRAILTLRARKRGRLSFYEAVRRLDIRESKDMSTLYMGYALKPAGASARAG